VSDKTNIAWTDSSTHKDDRRTERPPSPPAAGSVLPCPFCGTDVGDSGCTHYPDREEHYVWCSHCCTQSGRYQTRRQAIAAWNHRVPVSPNTELSGGEKAH
jgi:hypothetical protein